MRSVTAFVGAIRHFLHRGASDTEHPSHARPQRRRNTNLSSCFSEVFSDYMRPPIRLASIMEMPCIFIFTHDSIGEGRERRALSFTTRVWSSEFGDEGIPSSANPGFAKGNPYDLCVFDRKRHEKTIMC